MRSFLLLIVLVPLLSACLKTEFTGAPHFPNGVQGCRATCAEDGLEMSGFVYSGEFASSCVCRPKASGGWPTAYPPAPGAPPPPASRNVAPDKDRDALDAADASAAIGVVMQMREAQRQQQQKKKKDWKK